MESLLGSRYTRSSPVCLSHGRDESYHPTTPPCAVAFVKNTTEVQTIVTLCAKEKIHVIPFGAGTINIIMKKF